MNIGLIPWYLDAQNYVIVYLQWREAVLGDFQVIYFKNGKQCGTEDGTREWNDHWLDGEQYAQTLHTLTATDTITLSVEKKYDAGRGLDSYNVTISGTNAQQQTVSETFTSDAFSVAVPYAARTAKVGLYSMNNTVTFTDFSVEAAENSTNYQAVAGSDAVARTTAAAGWTYADGAYSVDSSSAATAADTQAVIPNPDSDNNYNISYTASLTGESGNVLSVLPYYADEYNFARFVITQTATGADIAIEGKVAGVAYQQSMEAYAGSIDWNNVSVKASKVGSFVNLYLNGTSVASYETAFTGGAQVAFGAKGNVTFTQVQTQSEAYNPYDWYTKDGYTISDRDMQSVSIDGTTVTMTTDAAEETKYTRFYAPAGNYYNRISVSGNFTVTENAQGAEYGLYLYYVDDSNNVRVSVTAEKVTLIVTQNGTSSEYEGAFAPIR